MSEPFISEARQERAEQTHARIETVLEIDPDELARETLGEHYQFTQQVPLVQEIVRQFSELSKLPIERLPIGRLQSIEDHCRQLTDIEKRVQAFNPREPNAQQKHTELVENCNNLYERATEQFQMCVAHLLAQDDGHSTLVGEARAAIETIQEMVENANADVEKVQTALEAARAVAADNAVTEEAKTFDTEATAHSEHAWWWRLATILLSLLTIVVICVGIVLANKNPAQSIPQAVQFVAAKLVLLTTLSFLTVWCARNYRAEKHNETVNKHRATALTTFHAFLEGAHNQSVKDAILLHAAQAAFTGRQTGYDLQERDPQNINPVVEILGRTMKSD